MKIAYQPAGVWRTFGCNSMALVAGTGRQVLLSGQVAWDEQRRVVGVGDMGAQTEQTLRNIKASLAAVGGAMDDIVSLLTHVTTLEGLEAIHDVRAAFFSELYPVSTLIQVTALVHPDLLLEITATAIVPEERYREPETVDVDTFDVSDDGFNLRG